MNRFLSKAKRIDNGEWVTGYYIYYDKDDFHGIMTKLFLRDFSPYEIDINTLCQCTGIKDKNDVLIFEGDIVGFEEEGYIDGHANRWTELYEVCFDELSYKFKPFVYIDFEGVIMREYYDDTMFGADMINNNEIDGVYIENIHDKESD